MPQEAEETAPAYFDAFNRRDWDGALALLHPEYSYTGRGSRRRDGPQAGLANSQIYAQRFPGLTLEIRHMHATETVAVVEYEPMLGQETDAKDRPLICTVLDMKDVRVRTEREYWQQNAPSADAT